VQIDMLGLLYKIHTVYIFPIYGSIVIPCSSSVRRLFSTGDVIRSSRRMRLADRPIHAQ
jgi:hypothetical protein